MARRVTDRKVRVALLGEDDVKEQEENAGLVAVLLPRLVEEIERLERELRDLGEELMMRTYPHV
jgi:hypothetical protein